MPGCGPTAGKTVRRAFQPPDLKPIPKNQLALYLAPNSYAFSLDVALRRARTQHRFTEQEYDVVAPGQNLAHASAGTASTFLSPMQDFFH